MSILNRIGTSGPDAGGLQRVCITPCGIPTITPLNIWSGSVIPIRSMMRLMEA